MLSNALAAILENESVERAVSAVPSGGAGYVRDFSIDGPYLEWEYVNKGDYDHNTLVTGSDIIMVGRYYGAFRGDANWDEARYADGNNDGAVTVADLTVIGANYGNKVAGYNLYQSTNYMDHPDYNGGTTGPGAVLVEGLIRGDYYDDPPRSFSEYISDLDETAFYWVVPTDGETEGRAGNLMGGDLHAWPWIEGVSPGYGPAGTEVEITGINFGAEQEGATLQMGGLDLEIVSWSDQELVAQIPEGAVTGPVRLQSGYFYADSPEFLVADVPVITAVSPDTLAFAEPFQLNGTGFLAHQGAGLLLVDGRVQDVLDWREGAISVGYMNPVMDSADPVTLQVICCNGLASAPVTCGGEFATVSVTVDPSQAIPPEWGEVSTTFTFNYEVSVGSTDYSVRLMPNANGTYPEWVEDQSAEPGFQYAYSNTSDDYIYKSYTDRYETVLELTDNQTGQTFTVDGPVVHFIEDGTTVLHDVYPLDFSRGETKSPNDLCYFADDDSYLDITFIDGVPCISSNRSSFADADGNALLGVERRIDSFLKCGENQRPYCYRRVREPWIPFLDCSTMSLTGENLGAGYTAGALHAFGNSIEECMIVDWQETGGWTGTEIRFVQNFFSDYSLYWRVVYDSDYAAGNVGDDLQVICSPIASAILPLSGEVSLRDGVLRLIGNGYVQQEIAGLTGDGVQSYWRLPVSYISPWTGTGVDSTGLLTYPVTPTYRDLRNLHLNTSGLDPDGDGMVTVEVFSDDGSESRIIDAELIAGEATFFLWTGILDQGSLQQIVHSGIFSECYDVTLVETAGDNQPPVADLACYFVEQDAPASVYLEAGGSEDPDGKVVDYEWDLDGDGRFNEINHDIAYSGEQAYHGENMIYRSLGEGTHLINVRVTDDRGATAVASLEIEVRDEYADLNFTVSVSNPDGYEDVSPTLLELFDSDPEEGATALESLEITHEFEPGDTETRHDTDVDYTDLPVGSYWVRLTNPDVDWRLIYLQGEQPVPDYYVSGPFDISGIHASRTYYGTVWH